MPLYTQISRLHPGYIAARFYPTVSGSVSNANVIGAIDTIYFYPFQLPAPITFTGGKLRVQTAGVGSSVKCGIWENSPISMRPLGAPLFKDDTGVTTQASNTDISPAIGSGTLYAGITYWFGSKYTGTLPVMWTINFPTTYMQFLSGTTSSMNATAYSFADIYSNANPTLGEGATFSGVATAVPHLWLAT